MKLKEYLKLCDYEYVFISDATYNITCYVSINTMNTWILDLDIASVCGETIILDITNYYLINILKDDRYDYYEMFHEMHVFMNEFIANDLLTHNEIYNTIKFTIQNAFNNPCYLSEILSNLPTSNIIDNEEVDYYISQLERYTRKHDLVSYNNVASDLTSYYCSNQRYFLYFLRKGKL